MFKLAFRRRKRVKVSKGQLPLFVEQNFDARALLSGLYNFSGTCIRPDGSFYGHGGSECRKGVAATPQELLGATKSGKVSSSASAIASNLNAESLKQLNSSVNEIEAVESLFEEKFKAQVERLKNGEVTPEELEKLFVEHTDYDISKAEVVFIGMENGLGRDTHMEMGNPDSSGQGSLAAMLTMQQMVDEGSATPQQVAIASHAKDLAAGQQDTKFTLNKHYIAVATDIANNVSEPTEFNSATAASIFHGGTKLATIEMNVPASYGTGFGQTDKAGNDRAIVSKSKGVVVSSEQSMDPGRSAYGAMFNGQAGPANTKFTRQYVEKNILDQRTKFIAEELKRASDSPTFKGGMAAPGSASSKNYKFFKKNVVDSLERGGTPVYTTKVKLSTGDNSKNERGTTKGNVTYETVNGKKVKTTEHTIHVIELKKGKYVVAGDFSLNTQGYGTNRNHVKAYQEGIKAVRTGTATRYKAPAKTPAASGGAARSTKSSPQKVSPTIKAGGKSPTQKQLEKAKKDKAKAIKEIKQELRRLGPRSAKKAEVQANLDTLKSELDSLESAL